MREPGLGKNNLGRSSVAILFLVLLCIGAFLTTHLLDSSSNVSAQTLYTCFIEAIAYSKSETHLNK